MTDLTLPNENRDHVRGRKDAPVTLLEYGDYECPHCGRAYWILKKIEQALGDDLRFAFRNFPLTQAHPHAFHAALAAEAAALQGKFWQMHDMIFEHQDSLGDESLAGYAEMLGLDPEQFVDDMASQKLQQRVQEELISGGRGGVKRTPTCFSHGE